MDAPRCANKRCRMPLIEYGYLERQGKEFVKTTVLICPNRRCSKRFKPVAYNTTVTLERRDAQTPVAP